MNMFIMPAAMWLIFQKDFERNLPVLGVSEPKVTINKAKRRYQELIHALPPYGENDVLLLTLLNAAMVAAIYLSLDAPADVDQMKRFYSKAMRENTVASQLFKSRKLFTTHYQDKLSAEAQNSQHATHPYTWRYKVERGETMDSFVAIFDKCGIWELYKHLGIAQITPALCAFDYDMAEMTDSVFTRECTLASGGPVCDCHYTRKK